jgi:dTDP-4-dehydrorhamnose 3,5-epimerase
MEELTHADLLDGFAASQKSYDKPTPLAGVEVYPLQRFVDDRGLFMEVYRRDVTHAGSERLPAFFAGVEVAQLNYSLVTVGDHIKGLHYHLKQSDIWFCPPPSKIKVVLYDIRKSSPTSGKTQVVVLGDGRDALVKIPPGVAHGYRPLVSPSGLFYVVTRCFDICDPDEHRVPFDHPAVKDLWHVKNE